MKNLLVENIDFQNFDLILIPETKNKIFLKLVNGLGKELIIAKKRTVHEVLELLSLEKLQKLERKKLETVLSSMEEVQLAKIAGNQRIRVGKLLFDIPNVENKKVLLLDDAIFTGGTLQAILSQTQIKDCFVLFGSESPCGKQQGFRSRIVR